MAEIEKVMNIALDDIEKLMNIGGDDIEKVNDLEYVTEVVWYGDRGLSIGGNYGNNEVIQYKAITSTGNMSDFADIGNYGSYGGIVRMATGSNKSRAVHTGGYGTNWNDDETASAGDINNIYYLTVGTTADSTDAADLTQARDWIIGSTNGTRMLNCGGNETPFDIVDYFAIASISNASDFGDLYAATMSMVGSINNATRAVIGTGYTDADTNGTGRMDYFSYASTGDASDFGDMSAGGGQRLGNQGLGGVENATRGLLMGGQDSASSDYRDYILYITVDTTGNATDFGDLIATVRGGYGNQVTGNAIKGEAYGYSNSSGVGQDNIQSMTIASTGNAADNGNMLGVISYNGAVSGT